MSRKSEPTPEQTRVLEYLRAHGGILVRRPGGFWTTPDAKGQQVAMTMVPDWYTTVQTVRAMGKKGLLVRANRWREDWRDDWLLPAPVDACPHGQPYPDAPMDPACTCCRLVLRPGESSQCVFCV